ncbi:ATP-binding protein [Mesorhizobium sp. M1066]|uniref:ATP-binding protein n=1 Tax=unclassified Mesorhizobium TaxID=325217 RepID=UPI00333A4EBA
MTSACRILLLEDNTSDAELIQEVLQAEHFDCEITRVQTRVEFITALEGNKIDLILADYKLPSFDGLSALKLALSAVPDLPFIFVSGTLGEEVAIEALKIGATDYVLKMRLSRLVPSVRRAMREAREKAERIKAEEALHAAQAELAHVNRITTMGLLTASIAHEVNQPIAAAVTNADAALVWLGRDPPDLEEVRQALVSIKRDANRAGNVIGRIRALIRNVPPVHGQLDINEAILEVIALARGEVAKNRVSVKTQLTDDLPTVQGDRVRLQQLILNLIVNAMEAMDDVSEEARALLVSTSKTGPSDVIVAVRDTGPGLPVEGFDRIFEAFYTTKPTGMGIGLSVCKSIVEAHGGRLWAMPNTPRGAVFQFTLPAQHDSAS